MPTATKPKRKQPRRKSAAARQREYKRQLFELGCELALLSERVDGIIAYLQEPPVREVDADPPPKANGRTGLFRR